MRRSLRASEYLQPERRSFTWTLDYCRDVHAELEERCIPPDEIRHARATNAPAENGCVGLTCLALSSFPSDHV